MFIFTFLYIIENSYNFKSTQHIKLISRSNEIDVIYFPYKLKKIYVHRNNKELHLNRIFLETDIYPRHLSCKVILETICNHALHESQKDRLRKYNQ